MTAGWVMESRANRWAPDRVGIKGALSEIQDGGTGTQGGLRENKVSKRKNETAAFLCSKNSLQFALSFLKKKKKHSRSQAYKLMNYTVNSR